MYKVFPYIANTSQVNTAEHLLETSVKGEAVKFMLGLKGNEPASNFAVCIDNDAEAIVATTFDAFAVLGLEHPVYAENLADAMDLADSIGEANPKAKPIVVDSQNKLHYEAIMEETVATEAYEQSIQEVSETEAIRNEISTILGGKKVPQLKTVAKWIADIGDRHEIIAGYIRFAAPKLGLPVPEQYQAVPAEAPAVEA